MMPFEREQHVQFINEHLKKLKEEKEKAAKGR
jgi:hypothetical protein